MSDTRPQTIRLGDACLTLHESEDHVAVKLYNDQEADQIFYCPGRPVGLSVTPNADGVSFVLMTETEPAVLYGAVLSSNKKGIFHQQRRLPDVSLYQGEEISPRYDVDNNVLYVDAWERNEVILTVDQFIPHG